MAALAIAPLGYDDIATYTRIELAAFEAHPRTSMSWPRGYTDDLYAYADAKHEDAFQDESNWYYKVVDWKTSEIVGVAKWTFVLDPSEGKAQAAAASPDPGPPENWPTDGNWALSRYWKQNFAELEREFLAGKRYIGMSRFSTDPNRPPYLM